MKPKAVSLAVAVAVVSGVVGLVAVGIVIAHAGHNADVFVRDHPGKSRSIGLAGSYILAAVVALLVALQFFGAWQLNNGRRSGWVLLLVLAGLGVLGVLTSRSLWQILSLIPDVVLIACLLMPSTRVFVDRRHEPAV